MSGKRVKGFLLLGGTFRVYHDPDNPRAGFTDYDIRHSDLEVEIVGEYDFYEDDDGEHILDHSLDVLGKTEDPT